MSQVDGSILIDSKMTTDGVKRGFRDMQDAAGKWAKSTPKELGLVEKSAMSLGRAIGVTSVAMAAWKIGGLAADATRAANQFERLSLVVHQLGANAGYRCRSCRDFCGNKKGGTRPPSGGYRL